MMTSSTFVTYDDAPSATRRPVCIPRELLNQIVGQPVKVDSLSSASNVVNKALIKRSPTTHFSSHLRNVSGADIPDTVTTHGYEINANVRLADDGTLRIDIPGTISATVIRYCFRSPGGA